MAGHQDRERCPLDNRVAEIGERHVLRSTRPIFQPEFSSLMAQRSPHPPTFSNGLTVPPRRTIPPAAPLRRMTPHRDWSSDQPNRHQELRHQFGCS
jgi:hypothetical protein